MNEELLKAISNMMDEKLKINQQETNEKLKTMSDMMDEKLKANQQETDLMINAIVDEMGKMESRINNRFSEVNERFNKIDLQLLSMQHDINACKLEKETLDILIRKIDQLEQRIERIEKKSA